jgi:hypothetical protein
VAVANGKAFNKSPRSHVRQSLFSLVTVYYPTCFV